MLPFASAFRTGATGLRRGYALTRKIGYSGSIKIGRAFYARHRGYSANYEPHYHTWHCTVCIVFALGRTDRGPQTYRQSVGMAAAV